MFLSTNNGISWTTVNTGLPHKYIDNLAVDGANLYTGSNGSGVWLRPLSQMITASVSEPSCELPTMFGVEQNYPNPFNPSTTIKYELPKSSMVRLSVYDMLGREVAVLVNKREDAGVRQTRFDASNLASGVYLYRLQAGDFLQSRKLIILR